MIRKLRRKLNGMVFLSLFLIVCCFVGSINIFNWHTLVSQAENTLEIFALNQGARPSLPDEARLSDNQSGNGPGRDMKEESGATPPPKPTGSYPGGAGRESEEERRWHERPVSSRESIAGLSNYYTITLAEDGSVTSWYSDRSDLYTDEQVSQLAAQITASGQESGRIGTQFFRISRINEDAVLAIVLDERLQMLNAQELFRNTVILGIAVYLLLCIASFFLIRRMFIPVEEANRKQRQFIWDASHELKTPIAVISANTEVLEREIGQNEWLCYIRSELDRTSQLVQNLLELARTDRETVKASMAPFDLSRAILSVSLPFESTVYENGKTMQTEVPDGVEMVGNSDMIQHLVSILLSNALKYSDPHGRITLSLEVRGRSRVIRVHNTGSYIEREDRERIFDRFYRADSSHSREVEGHGLGLAIAHNIVEMHGGKITVESEKGQGTAFVVAL